MRSARSGVREGDLLLLSTGSKSEREKEPRCEPQHENTQPSH